MKRADRQTKEAIARALMCRLSADDQLLLDHENPHLSPEMRAEVEKELMRRDLIAGNWQI